MKQAFAAIILFAFSILTAETADLIDIRFGSYVLGEFVASDTRNADETRIIFEFDHPVEYTATASDGRIHLEIIDVRSKIPQTKFEIDNGLVSLLELKPQERNLGITVFFEGTYRTHRIDMAEDPVRLVLNLYGKPVAAVPDRNDAKKSAPGDIKPVIRRVGTTSNIPVPLSVGNATDQWDDRTLSRMFPDDGELYLDLYEVPLQQVLRYFSKRSRLDIIPDGAIDGLVTLSIKNQRLSEAFGMVLQSQGLTFHLRDSSVIVTSKREKEEDCTLYAVYLRNIDVLDMKVALDFFLPENHFILPDRRTNKLDIYLPRQQIAMVDSLVARYDAPSAETVIQTRTILLEPEGFSRIEWNDDGFAVVDQGIMPNLDDVEKGDAVRTAMQIHQKEYSREMKRKAYRTGLPVFSSSRVVLMSGYEAFLTLHMGRSSHFSLDVDLTWHLVNPDLVQSDDRMQISADLDHGQTLLMYNKRYFQDHMKFDNWLESEPSFTAGSIPVLVISIP